MSATSVSQAARTAPGLVGRWFRQGESVPDTSKPAVESGLARIRSQ
jgi:hypothetical protein